MRISGNGNKNRGRLIRIEPSSRLWRALALSLLAHLLLVLLLGMAPDDIGPTLATRQPVQVRLQRVLSATGPQPALPEHDVQLAPPSKTAKPSANSTRRAKRKPPPGHWLETARDVVQDMSRADVSPLLAPDFSDPGFGNAKPSRIPGLESAFKPLPLTEICGAMVEFKLGIHDISMPTAYRCESKQEEFRSAPIGDDLRERLESHR